MDLDSILRDDELLMNEYNKIVESLQPDYNISEVEKRNPELTILTWQAFRMRVNGFIIVDPHNTLMLLKQAFICAYLIGKRDGNIPSAFEDF